MNEYFTIQAEDVGLLSNPIRVTPLVLESIAKYEDTYDVTFVSFTPGSELLFRKNKSTVGENHER